MGDMTIRLRSSIVPMRPGESSRVKAAASVMVMLPLGPQDYGSPDPTGAAAAAPRRLSAAVRGSEPGGTVSA